MQARARFAAAAAAVETKRACECFDARRGQCRSRCSQPAGMKQNDMATRKEAKE